MLRNTFLVLLLQEVWASNDDAAQVNPTQELGACGDDGQQACDIGQSLIQRLIHRSELRTNSTFASFLVEHGRNYKEGSPQYAMRQAVYEKRVADMEEHNDQDLAWKVTVNSFADWTEDELRSLRGYKRHKRSATSASFLEMQAASQTEKGSHVGDSNSEACAARSKSCGQHGVTYTSCCSDMVCGFEGRCEAAPVIPESKIWGKDDLSSADHVLDQGSCGSCWAVAAAMVIQLHADKHAKAHGKTPSLISAQAMLGCTQNPDECGGTGGCDGATPELAFSWARDNWISSTTDESYEATGECPTKPSLSVARIGGHVTLPLNKEKPVLQALVNVGPLSVAVAASEWYSYGSGILSCKDTTVDHAVTLMGFAKDYWYVKNSWGSGWGQHGHVMIKRHPGNEPCGKDTDMQVGVGCKNDPKEATVCGECGILSDVSYPIGTEAL